MGLSIPINIHKYADEIINIHVFITLYVYVCVVCIHSSIVTIDKDTKVFPIHDVVLKGCYVLWVRKRLSWKRIRATYGG